MRKYWVPRSDGRPRLRGGLVGAVFHLVALLLTGKEGVAPRPLRRSFVFPIKTRRARDGSGGGGGRRLGSGEGLAGAVLHPVALSLGGDGSLVGRGGSRGRRPTSLAGSGGPRSSASASASASARRDGAQSEFQKYTLNGDFGWLECAFNEM
ncbi:hypothetical protein NL676_005354 [Syzygium grande]|nr:hypothetical protein NL676_005354 [Syzygium grande]